MSSQEEDEIEFFKQLLRIRTVSAEGPSGAYEECVEFLKTEIEKRVPGIQTQVLHFSDDKKPVLYAVLPGTDASLKQGILLNSHYDVVPALEEHWDYDPFAATEEDGKIYARGTQDMKCVCAQYILALQRMTAQGVKLRRTVYLTFVPDEEIGGVAGMGELVKSQFFNDLKEKIGVAMDEGIANPSDEYTLFYGERAGMWIHVTATGPTGHGSRFIADTAVEKLIKLSTKAFTLRKEQEESLGYTQQGCSHCEAKKLGDVLTINLTMLHAGCTSDGGKTYSLNVIPTEAKAGFDIRVPPAMPVEEVRGILDEWTKAEGMSWDYAPGHEDPGKHHVSSTDSAESPWWRAVSKAFEETGIKVNTEIFPAATDSRYLRQFDIPAFGFSPMRNSPILLHEHNEFLSRSVFLEGIGSYTKVLGHLGNTDLP